MNRLLLIIFFHAISQTLSWTLLSLVNRRDILIGGSAAAVGGIDKFINPQGAYASEPDQSQADLAPVAVLGASGRTGALCVEACLNKGIPVRALTRDGTWKAPEGGLLSVVPCDVTNSDALYQGIKGSRAVIYAASASKKGGTPKDIDNDGVAAAAEACLKANVGRYVVLSSTAVTRPKSLGYIFTNLSVGGIMDEKRKGEERVATLFDQTAPSSLPSPSYTIIRPGGLEEPKKNVVMGPSTLEISQGDVLAGIVSRADLAEVTVELAMSDAPNLHNTALELYYTDSVQPCEGRFKSLLSNGSVQRLHGATYDDLFRGIQPNVDYHQQ